MTEPTATHQCTILIVDDGPENLRVAGEILKPHYKVRVTTEGERALEIARSTPAPDLILLDIMMPGMDGYQVLARLRECADTRDIPVIFVTALDSLGDETRGLELGAVDYITKPLIPELMLARVRNQIELKSARDWLQDRNTVLAREVARQLVEIQAARQRAEVASQAKSTFIRTMSHELYTPMNGIVGMLQLIRGESNKDSPVADYAREALEAAHDMTAQLTDILEYSELSGSEIPLHDNLLDLPALLNELSSEWENTASRKHLLLQRRDSHSELTLYADEKKLRRVLNILIDNAIALTQHGAVTLECTLAAGHAWVIVRDTGPGLATGEISRLFKPFEQGDSSFTRPHGGIGLGLAIAHRLAEVMQGELTVESTAGSGSAFHLRLPLKQA